MNFLLAALSIKEEGILCSSNPDQGLDYRFTGVPDQLKERLKNSEALILLITADSLHSTWIPFEVGIFWTTDKPVIPILGPGLIHDNLPGPLRSLLSISIDAKDWSDKVNSAINQLAKRLQIELKVTKRRNDTLQEFSDALRAWQSKRPAALESHAENEQLKALIQELEVASQKEKAASEELKLSFKSQIRHLKQQLGRARITSTKIIKIFLASSSELKEDRVQFEIFINRKNKEYIRKGIFLELVMWEDFLDAMSLTRLQDEYNKEIVNCNVFVSLFHTKVGQYTEEEFLTALETFKANEKLLVYTYFKDEPIPPSRADQIRSLLDFKDKLSELRHFYKLYKSIEELILLFDQQLDKFIPKLIDDIEPVSLAEKDELEQLKQELEEERLHNQELKEKERSLQVKIEELEKEGSQNNVQSIQVQSFAEDLGDGLRLEMVTVPGGKFMMGTEEEEVERLVKEYEDECFRNEKPQHEVMIRSFLIGKYPVTQAQYEKVMGKNPSKCIGDDRRPVETVTWNEAVEFCRKISKKTGKEYRLPSEAEWEYACRAGTTTQYHFGDDITSKLANYNRNIGKTTVVGKYPPNNFGLYDMHGNVWEWCQDDLYDDYVGAPNDGSAWISSKNSIKVVRSGSWLAYPGYCRSASRDKYLPDFASNLIGFRVVCVGARI